MATESETRKSKNEKRRKLGGLFAEFKKLSPSLTYECTEDEARHLWASDVLKKPVASWSALTQNEVNRLIRVARNELGETPLNDYIARAAVRLFGSNWNEALAERMKQRFRVSGARCQIAALEFWQKKSLFEELVGRIARAESVGVGLVVGQGGHAAEELAARTEDVRMEIVRSRG